MRDVARFFSMSGVTIAPDAAEGILGELIKLKHHDYKVRYAQKFLKLFKEWQSLQQRSDHSAGQENSAQILTRKVAEQIASTNQMQGFDPAKVEQRSTIASLHRGGQASVGTSFKDMKRQARQMKEDQTNQNENKGNEEMREEI